MQGMGLIALPVARAARSATEEMYARSLAGRRSLRNEGRGGGHTYSWKLYVYMVWAWEVEGLLILM